MKKFFVGAMAAGLLVGGAGLAQAAAPQGDNGKRPSDYGHCQALMGPGNHNGWYKDGHSVPAPFQDVIDRADTSDDNQPTTPEELADFCASTTPGNK
jgi:hypothetical protein